MRWFRLYSEFAIDPKITQLPDFTQLAFVKLLCMKANEFLPATDKFISLFLGISEKKWKKEKKILLNNKLIFEKFKPESIAKIDVTNWRKRQCQSDFSAKRTKKYRRKIKKNVTVL